jgi:hypothetical protein
MHQFRQIGIEPALRLLDEVRAEAARQGLLVAAAVADRGGNPVASARMDGAALGAMTLAVDKAYTAVLWEVPTGEFMSSTQPGGADWGLQHHDRRARGRLRRRAADRRRRRAARRPRSQRRDGRAGRGLRPRRPRRRRPRVADKPGTVPGRRVCGSCDAFIALGHRHRRHRGGVAVGSEYGAPVCLPGARCGHGRRLPRGPVGMAGDARNRRGCHRADRLGDVPEHSARPRERALERTDHRAAGGAHRRRERGELGVRDRHRRGDRLDVPPSPRRPPFKSGDCPRLWRVRKL